MTVRHYLIGFDKQTELVAQELLIADGLTSGVADWLLADPSAEGSVPLSTRQVQQISGLAGLAVDPDAYDWLLQAYDEPESG